jgi:hypothetical protein
VRGRLKFNDLVLVAGIRVPLLFYDYLELKSFKGEFIRQALKERALFGIRRQLTHNGKVSGVRAELIQSWPEVLHVVPAWVQNSSSAETITLLAGMTHESTAE